MVCDEAKGAVGLIAQGLLAALKQALTGTPLTEGIKVEYREVQQKMTSGSCRTQGKVAYSWANVCSVFKANTGLASPSDYTCACFDILGSFRSSPLAGKPDTQLQNDGRNKVDRYAGQNGEIIGPEVVKEGFLEGEVLGGAETGPPILYLPLLSSFLLHSNQPTWNRQWIQETHCDNL